MQADEEEVELELDELLAMDLESTIIKDLPGVPETDPERLEDRLPDVPTNMPEHIKEKAQKIAVEAS